MPTLPVAASVTPTVEPEPAPEPTVRPDMAKLNYGPRTAEGLQAILGTGDLGVGTNRFGFVMTSQTGFVTEPTTKLSTRFVPDLGDESDVVHRARRPTSSRGPTATVACTPQSWTSTARGPGGWR